MSGFARVPMRGDHSREMLLACTADTIGSRWTALVRVRRRVGMRREPVHAPELAEAAVGKAEKPNVLVPDAEPTERGAD